jgi:hypothetical protein
VNQTIDVKAVGTLTMHGVTKPVTVTMQARDTGSTIEATGQIPVTFSDWNIANPSFGSFVKTEDNGLVEFLVRPSVRSLCAVATGWQGSVCGPQPGCEAPRGSSEASPAATVRTAV